MASTPGARQAPSPLLKRVLDRFRSEHGQPVPASPEALSLQLALRRLWADHVIWTREYVVAAIANSPRRTGSRRPAARQPRAHRQRDRPLLRRTSQPGADRPAQAAHHGGGRAHRGRQDGR